MGLSRRFLGRLMELRSFGDVWVVNTTYFSLTTSPTNLDITGV